MYVFGSGGVVEVVGDMIELGLYQFWRNMGK